MSRRCAPSVFESVKVRGWISLTARLVWCRKMHSSSAPPPPKKPGFAARIWALSPSNRCSFRRPSAWMYSALALAASHLLAPRNRISRSSAPISGDGARELSFATAASTARRTSSSSCRRNGLMAVTLSLHSSSRADNSAADEAARLRASPGRTAPAATAPAVSTRSRAPGSWAAGAAGSSGAADEAARLCASSGPVAAHVASAVSTTSKAPGSSTGNAACSTGTWAASTPGWVPSDAATGCRTSSSEWSLATACSLSERVATFTTPPATAASE
mmetsp:Transcript_28000/g.90541  ORF Transcript_28000/g.90541 Transcript_28000/m.90541 type:complete len:274 (-) Transcript_28000:142-963(-)